MSGNDPDRRTVTLQDGFAYEERTITGSAGELHLIASGDPDGRPVVFMHGITEFARSFLPVMKLLPASYYAVSVDLRGRGGSFKPETGYRLSDYTGDLLAVWNGFRGPKRPVLVGHSLSGRIAAAFTAAYPGLVEGLMLCDPPISGPGRRPFPNPVTRFTEPKAALAAGNMDAFASYYGGHIDLKLKAEELAACSLAAIEESYRSLNEEPFHAYYRQISVPTLLLAAGRPPLITEEELEELRLMNPFAQAKRIPDVGHEIFKEDPQLFVRELLDFSGALALG